MPILMLTARGDAMDRSSARLGADDYLPNLSIRASCWPA